MEDFLIEKSKAKKLKTLVRSVFFALFCGIILTVNYLWERSSVSYTASYLNEVSFSENMAYFPWNGYANMSEQGILSVDTVEGDEYVFTLDEGRVWLGALKSGLKINVRVADKIVIIPSFSDTDVLYDGESVRVSTYRGNTYVGFLADGFSQFKFMGEYDGMFSNVLLIPQGATANVVLGKTGDRLSPLLPSKLAKEFSYRNLSISNYEDDFVKTNLKNGKKFIEALKEFYREDFKKMHKSGTEYSSLYDTLSDKFVVFEQKKVSKELDNANKFIYSALSAGNISEREDALSGFTSLDVDFSEKFFADWFKRLIVFDRSDSEFAVFEFLMKESKPVFGKTDLAALSLGSYNNVFYSGVSVGQAFSSVYLAVESLFGFTSEDVLQKRVLNFYNQIFDSFFLNFAELYKEEYMMMKDRLEKELFSLYEKGWMKEEMKQSFVNSKIKFLKRSRDFFFDEKIEIVDAKKAMSYLIESIDYYMPVETSRAAVVKLFEDQLNDIGNYWGYINSVEYSRSSLYGSTHKERYVVYLAERDQLTGILDVQKDVLGENVASSYEKTDVVAEVQSELFAIGASDIYVDSFDDEKKRFIKFAAVLDGYSFNAEYDRDYKSVRNLYAYGELLSLDNVKLDSLKGFLSKKLSAVVEEIQVSSSSSPESQDTNAQKIAKTIVAKEIIKAGFSATIDDVDILDPVNAVYRFNGISITGKPEIKISFNYYANTSTVENVFVVKNRESRVLTGTFPFEDLKDIVLEERY